jgi:glycosyltransferase involved in cell wall biosynthesis
VEQRIRQSSLFASHQVERIPLAVDAGTFRPFDKSVARDLLHLPPDKKIVLFGAHYLTDPRKGMPLLMNALHALKERIKNDPKIEIDNVFLLIAGLNARQALQSLTELPFASKFAGHLDSDVLMALAYQAADIFICSSVEDAGPMMVAEAMLCGLPVAAFETGGAPDIIKHRQTGYLAKLGDTADLANGIYFLLTAQEPEAMRTAARQSGLAAHAPAVVVERHLTLYCSLLDARGQAS